MNISSLSSWTSTAFFFKGLDVGPKDDEGPGSDGPVSDAFGLCFGFGRGRGRFASDMFFTASKEIMRGKISKIAPSHSKVT